MSTFATLQSDVFQILGLDSTNSQNQTNVQRWINMIQQDIAGRWPWNFLRGREVLSTVPDYTTGTVSVTSGGTTVTGSGTTFTSTMANGSYFIQFSTSSDWYLITGYTSATQITIEAGYEGTTNLSGGTFTIRKWYYSLSANADRILDIVNRNTPLALVETDPVDMDELAPKPGSPSFSSGYIAYGYDSAGNVRITPIPFPADTRLLEVRTFLRVSDLSANTDVSVIPAKWHHIISFGASALGFMFMRKLDLAVAWRGEYETKIGDMMSQAKTSEDDAAVMRSVDQASKGSLFISWPGSYPSNG